MQAAWAKAKLVVGRAEKPFAHLAGPVGATLASILRLGWSMPNRHTFKLADGLMIDMHDVCPVDVAKLATEAMTVRDGALSLIGQRLGGAPDY